ncbi:SIR2 family protein [Labilibaculum sp. K2S]|uniref:SIR2 family protein n=1 Tax=Labilibaculum sp. K2S TaxID=3056386 RepID=UPI0025A34116|nr:SIR2 family protein [Labilibaculum sp. K2S]MDM8159656.1 SIR2 family protein [Labilibaculum sp. K2S]
MKTHTPLFLFGNGLSIALSGEFSLKNITAKFIAELKGDEMDFFQEICGGNKNINFDDFEANFSQIEDAYSSLKNYRKFIDSKAGEIFLQKFELSNPELIKHEEIIKLLYNRYIYQILGIIHGNVTKVDIERKLKGFTNFLKQQLSCSKKGYVFTLNYDLLAETILLEEIGSNNITDFCSATHKYLGTDIDKFDFDPALNDHKYGDDYTNANVELHHLHGSLSLFYDSLRNKCIKFRSEDIFNHKVYESIGRNNWCLSPVIITGGGKSLKMNEYPFEFYFRNFKDLSTYGKYNKLFIVGYSFRDEHVNELINRWMKSVKDYSDALLIVDYKSTEEDKDQFKKFVRKQIKKRPNIPDKCFEFGGANSIKDVSGTEVKEE